MEGVVKHYILETFREKYHLGSKKAKGEILDEVCGEFGWHRKHAIRELSKPIGKKPSRNKRGRKSKYDGPDFLKALYQVRRVMEFRNAEVMKENMPEWLPFIEGQYGAFSPDVREKLLSISASTMKRKFRRLREEAGKGLSTTRPGSILRTEIPICTESEWNAPLCLAKWQLTP